jgi:protein-S-isoprenylcysteine O-methyltransferase Ste14
VNLAGEGEPLTAGSPDRPRHPLATALLAGGLNAALLLSARLAPGAASDRLSDPATCAFLALWIGWSVLEAGLALGGREPTGGAARRDRTLAALTGAALLVLAWHALWAAPAWRGGGPWPWIAAAGLAAGAVLRIAAVRQLGARFVSAACADAATPLATSGVYSWVRHPSETGLLLASLGAALLLRSAVSLALWAAVLVPLSAARVHREDRVLDRVHGKVHREYRRRTGALLPRASRCVARRR